MNGEEVQSSEEVTPSRRKRSRSDSSSSTYLLTSATACELLLPKPKRRRVALVNKRTNKPKSASTSANENETISLRKITKCSHLLDDGPLHTLQDGWAHGAEIVCNIFDTPCQRVLVVPLTSTLEELYNVICIAFGWHSLVSSEDYFVHPMEGVFGSAPKSTKPTTRRSAQKQQTTANSESKSIKVFHYYKTSEGHRIGPTETGKRSSRERQHSFLNEKRITLRMICFDKESPTAQEEEEESEQEQSKESKSSSDFDSMDDEDDEVKRILKSKSTVKAPRHPFGTIRSEPIVLKIICRKKDCVRIHISLNRVDQWLNPACQTPRCIKAVGEAPREEDIGNPTVIRDKGRQRPNLDDINNNLLLYLCCERRFYRFSRTEPDDNPDKARQRTLKIMKSRLWSAGDWRWPTDYSIK